MIVVAAHLALQHATGEPARYFELFANLGVRVFFVISGFLITGLLIREIDRRDTISLSRFYFRRTLRIFPPYYTLIIVMVVLSAIGFITLAPNDALHALTYTSNYYPKRSWYFGHLWSLGVEEQFYLLWPAALLVLGKRKGLSAAASLIVLCPIIRMLTRGSGYEIGKTFETVADSLAVGCVLAGAKDWLQSNATYQRVLGSPLFIIVPLTVLAACALQTGRPTVKYLLTFTTMNIGIALCVNWAVTRHDGRAGHLLNSRVLSHIGVMSYSIYLWQQVFLHPDSPYVLSRFPFNALGIVVLSSTSYYLIERPSLTYRQRLEGRLFGRPSSSDSLSKVALPRSSL
jgi:peptidoglycan/LPS O-acetylase OafA/YrhL